MRARWCQIGTWDAGSQCAKAPGVLAAVGDFKPSKIEQMLG